MQAPLSVPLEEVYHETLSRAGISLFVKREDLTHPDISGNKWRKLLYNVAAAKEMSFNKIITFGGAFSNHIAATAFAGKAFGFETIGVIRGEEAANLSPTLRKAREMGMQLHFISREDYRRKQDTDFTDALLRDFGPAYVIPEGAANALGVKGCEEIVQDISIPFDYICCACGTGTTMAGIINGLDGKAHALGFSALKAEGLFKKEIPQWLHKPYNNWNINYDYHFGGYAKINEELKSFIYAFYKQTNIPLDGVYTGKMIYGILDLAAKGYFEKGSRIIAVHTGGLQGNAGLGILL